MERRKRRQKIHTRGCHSRRGGGRMEEQGKKSQCDLRCRSIGYACVVFFLGIVNILVVLSLSIFQSLELMHQYWRSRGFRSSLTGFFKICSLNPNCRTKKIHYVLIVDVHLNAILPTPVNLCMAMAKFSARVLTWANNIKRQLRLFLTHLFPPR